VHGCAVVLSGSDMVAAITCGPVLALELQGENAIQRWMELRGPADSAVARTTHPSSLSARFGTGTAAVLLLSPKKFL